MGYRYETHLHTKEGSACAGSSGIEMARAHKRLGYTGIFVTDHFFNGNSAVPRDLPWKERIELYCSGYEHAKAEGDKIGLDVFFGIEYGVNQADFLIYNLDKEWLLAHEDIDQCHARTAFEIMHKDGAFIVHAHPFRERSYVDHIELFPRDMDAVEAINGAHWDHPEWNERAAQYAKTYELPITAGSDSHHLHTLYGSGVVSEVRFQTPLDYLKQIRKGTLELLEPTYQGKT